MRPRWRRAALGGLLIAACVALWVDRSGGRLPAAPPQHANWAPPVPRPAAAPPDLAASSPELVGPHAGAPLERLTGLVVDVGAGPIAGAEIAFGEGHTVSTNEHGAFIADLPRGLYPLAVRATGYAPAIEEAVVPGRITISLYPEAVIEGRIVQGSTDQPVSEAFLLLNGTALRSELSDPFGAFRFDMLRPGQYGITARAAGWAARAEEEIEVDAGETRQIVIRARPAFSVEAEVIVEATGERCASAYVVLESAHGLAEARGDPSGRVLVDGLLPGKYAVRVGCAGWGSAEQPEIRIEGSSLRGLRWTMPARRHIRGLALSEFGGPAVGVMVLSTPLGGDSFLPTSTTTDESGAFDLRGVSSGSHTVFAHLGASYTSTLVRVGSTDVEGIVLRPRPTTTVTAVLEGLVVTQDEQPVTGLELAIEPGGRPEPSQRVVTDAEGRFSATLRAPTVGVRIEDDRGLTFVGWSEGRSLALRPGAVTRARFVVARTDQSIRGRVVDASREPVVGVSVVAMPEREGKVFERINRGWTRPMAQALSDGDGSFELAGLYPGRYRVRAVRAGGGQAVARAVRAPSALELVIAETGAISGRVTGDHEPPSSFVILADHLGDEFSRRGEFSAASGAFTLRDLPPGRYRLTARGEDSGGSVEVDLASGQHRRGVEIRLRRSRSLTGRVLWAHDRRGIPDCSVRLEGEPGFVMAQTDLNGEFTFRAAGPGPIVLHLVCFSADGGGSCRDRIAVDVPSDRPLDVGTILMPLGRTDDPDVELGLGMELEGGRITAIREPSPAARAGLRPGDTILAVNGFDVRRRPLAIRCLLDAPGETRTLSLARGARASIVIP